MTGKQIIPAAAALAEASHYATKAADLFEDGGYTIDQALEKATAAAQVSQAFSALAAAQSGAKR